jgi:hypothetical protein
MWPKVTKLLFGDCAFTPCEDGAARYLKPAETLAFLDQAKNVL